MIGNLSGLSKRNMHTLPLNQALSVFEENLPEIRQACLSNAAFFVELYSPHAELQVDDPFTPDNIKAHVNHIKIAQVVSPVLKTVRRIDSYRVHKNNPNPSMGVTDTDIDNARHVEADWFVQEASLSTRKPHKGICPFHSDTDPSLMLMRSKSTGKHYLKCFVCNDTWDSIKYIESRDNVDFINAVKYIIS